MIIERLEVKGSGKAVASIELTQGLNVIAGPSDTGKSYITECLSFIFGSEQVPKEIEQAKGYTHLEVIFRRSDNSRFLLSRELKNKSDITCIELDNGDTKTILKPNHKGALNLSEFILKQINLDGNILVKGTESLNHSSLTLRILEKIFLVDESRIISEKSPLGKGQNNEKTLELSLLKTLLLGEDDSAIKELKKKKLSKDSISKEISYLNRFLKAFFHNPDGDEEINIDWESQLEQLEAQYENVEENLKKAIEDNKTFVDERAGLVKESEELIEKIISEESLVNRFTLLLDKYQSDKERLQANSEAANYLLQYEELACPLCGGDFEESFDTENILIANSAEVLRIDNYVTDLGEVIK
ncbi:TPA: AAA family ATPase, partial [Vibrio parahaemolyticus]